MTTILTGIFGNPRVNVTESGCWEWTGARSKAGYGQIRIGRELHYVHRLSYALLVGLLDSSLTIDHLCRNRACFNPEHLEQVGGRENGLRGTSPPAVNSRKTHCPEGHPYSPENTYITSVGWRQCRTCQVTRQRRYAAARREARKCQP